MSRINDLIKELCPNGVRFFKVKDIAKITIGEFVHKNKQSDDGEYPVYNGGTSNTGFYDEYNNDGHKVIISARGANAGFVNRVVGKYWAGNSCYTININNESELNWNYLYQYLKNNQTVLLGVQQTGSIPAISKKQVEEFKIAIPPIEVQEEIVKILDKFGELEAKLETKLEAELEDRRSQYEFWRRKLLNSKTATEYKLKDLVDLYLGLTYTPNYVDSGIKFISSLNISKDYLNLSNVKYISKEEFDNCTSNSKPKKGDVLYVRVGSNLGHPVIYDLDEDICVFVSVGFARVKDNNILFNRYLRHWMSSDMFMNQVKAKTKNAPKANLNATWMKEFTIFVPSLEEQQRIVNILDKFDKLVNDISVGLPAEIEARRKQYEYYRNKLLSFEEVSYE